MLSRLRDRFSGQGNLDKEINRLNEEIASLNARYKLLEGQLDELTEREKNLLDQGRENTSARRRLEIAKELQATREEITECSERRRENRKVAKLFRNDLINLEKKRTRPKLPDRVQGERTRQENEAWSDELEDRLEDNKETAAKREEAEVNEEIAGILKEFEQAGETDLSKASFPAQKARQSDGGSNGQFPSPEGAAARGLPARGRNTPSSGSEESI